MAEHRAAPLPLARETDFDAVCVANPCNTLHVLGSFWPYSIRGYESRLVKAFKESCPVPDYQPHISELCEFYSACIVRAVGPEKIDWIARVLNSSESELDPSRPQSLLMDCVARRTGASAVTHVFFKSGSRPPMRTVGHLSGPEALRARVRYAAQDLFIRPMDLGGTVLLIDDIMNTGASMRVYAGALKRWAGAKRVVCVNLAVTRFERGRDGWGRLILDTSEIQSRPGMDLVWIDQQGLYHKSRECGETRSKSTDLRFIAQRKCAPCPVCYSEHKPPRKWWQVWGP